MAFSAQHMSADVLSRVSYWVTFAILLGLSLTPVWMVGLCLLYIDERVRHEGYDIELMAARRLGDIPDVPQDYLNPLQPALASSVEKPLPTAKASAGRFTTLDLK